jgi:hypothetical protein
VKLRVASAPPDRFGRRALTDVDQFEGNLQSDVEALRKREGPDADEPHWIPSTKLVRAGSRLVGVGATRHVGGSRRGPSRPHGTTNVRTLDQAV